MKKETKIQLIIIAVLIIILGILVLVTINEMNNERPIQMDGTRQEFGGQNEEKTEKETKASDVDTGQEVLDSNIDLSKYNSNITITKSGEYTLKGEFKNAVLVNAQSDVTLILDGVNIENTITATIANIGTSELTIKLADNSTNTLSDGGASEYDSCIYSNGKLTIF